MKLPRHYDVSHRNEIRAFVTEYLDPNGTLRFEDDPAKIVTQLGRIFQDEGGAGITVRQMRLYLDTLERQ